MLEERARSEHAIRATLVAIDSPGPGPDCPGIRDLDELLALLPADKCSVLDVAHPALALRCQAVTGSELVLDLVYDRRRKRRFALTTRGVIGGAFSDIAFWLGFSPDFVVLPCLHTHPNPAQQVELRDALGGRLLRLGRGTSAVGGCLHLRPGLFSQRTPYALGVDAQGEWFSAGSVTSACTWTSGTGYQRITTGSSPTDPSCAANPYDRSKLTTQGTVPWTLAFSLGIQGQPLTIG